MGACARREDEDASAQALKDLHTGMAGLKEATQNPALLAQLMRDLQDPELMAEAKKMMENPEFQKKAKMEHMLKVGNNQLKNMAGSVMEDAMAAMSNPEVMAEVSKMVKDPNF